MINDKYRNSNRLFYFNIQYLKNPLETKLSLNYNWRLTK